MPRYLKTYIYLVTITGMAVLSFFLLRIEISFLPAILSIGIIAGVLEKFDIELPNGTIFSGSTIFAFVVMAVYGIPEAVVIEIIISLVSIPLIKSERIKFLYNTSQYIICIVAAGYAYVWVGGVPGDFHWSDIPRLLFAIAVDSLLNFTLLSVIISRLSERKYFATWIEMVQDGVFIYLVSSLLSVRLALSYEPHDQLQFWIEALFVFVAFLALRYAFALFINLRKTYLTTMESLTQLTENKLSISGGHATRVGRIARKMAEKMKLSQDEIDAIHYAALLHDLGKAYLEEKIFQKRGPLTLEEEREYRKHAEIGADMVKEINGLAKAAEYIRYHHECWDGTGFPAGISGERIPLGARIIAAADQYDHIFYKKKTPADFAALAGTKLDPQVVEIVLGIADLQEEPREMAMPATIEEKLIENLVISEARKRVYQSQLLDKFGASLIVHYNNGEFRNEAGDSIDIPCREQVITLVEKARIQQGGVREILEEAQSGKIYDIYCVPTGDEVSVIFFDVTDILEYEKKQEERVRNLYREVIYSVTQGKLLLVEQKEIELLKTGVHISSHPILAKTDVANCRRQVQEVLESRPLPPKVRYNILLGTSEAVTNVLKHATEGQMSLYMVGDLLRIFVSDNGSGIDLSELPRTTLMAGYSTKHSVGWGFSLLLKTMDRIVLSTGPRGTTIVLEIKLVDTPEKVVTNNITTLKEENVRYA
ncbi:HD domain-containing protein [Desulfallas sp. Bu1-1]|uniref:HD domain-containing phosphohydrolase n=1 Tax=Desulfallas sp. Bu1-1 TaxID=2787620 RepID=UPI00189C99DB|nr:HD domain-containing phosphohydrolase [Desulfallas sp. Bu1-1]MBF7084014.1 HD domain-containing protein [Desulfallas sp. Bu1-1]